MKEYLLLLKMISVTIAVELDHPGSVGWPGHANITAMDKDYNLENTTDVNVTKDSKSVFFVFVIHIHPHPPSPPGYQASS